MGVYTETIEKIVNMSVIIYYFFFKPNDQKFRNIFKMNIYLLAASVNRRRSKIINTQISGKTYTYFRITKVVSTVKQEYSSCEAY